VNEQRDALPFERAPPGEQRAGDAIGAGDDLRPKSRRIGLVDCGGRAAVFGAREPATD
jgi:hypothetical protein